MSEGGKPMAVVLFTESYCPNTIGPMFAKGEMAAISEEEAALLCLEGAAVRIQDAAGYDSDFTKAVTRPPNKMVDQTATITKG